MMKAKDGKKYFLFMSSGTLVGSVAFLAGGSSLFAAEIPEFRGYQTHTHIQIPIEVDVNYILEKISEHGKDQGLRIIFKNIQGTNLYALNGSVDMSRWVDGRTTRVQRRIIGNDVIFEFYLTEQVRKTGVEYFDYRDRAQSAVNLDYWAAQTKTGVLSTVHGEQAQQSNHKIGRTIAAEVKKTKTQKSVLNEKRESVSTPAALLGSCDQPLVLERDGFTFWTVYHKSFNYKGYFNLETPDVKYEYQEPKLTAKDKKNDVAHYRLALKLYKANKFGLVLRTIDFFEKQFLKSSLSSELRFLKANTFLKLSRQLQTDWYWAQALQLFRNIMLEEPTHDRAKAVRAFVVQELMEQKKYVQALEYAVMGSAYKDQHEVVYHLAAAESLQAIGEHDRAERTYQQVWDQGSQTVLAVEGAFRLGEIYFSRKNFERAEHSFTKAFKEFPQFINRYPTSVFNLAETYFRLGRYRDAQEMYHEFQKRFPLDPYLWAADLRMAELEHIQLREPNSTKIAKIREMYEKVINRHPYAPGSFLAELRLASCADIEGSKQERNFFQHFYQTKNLEIQQSPLISYVELKRWVDLSELRFYNRKAEYQKALPYANEYRAHLKGITLGNVIRDEIQKAISQIIIESSNGKKYKEALELYSEYQDYLDTPRSLSVLLALVRAYEGLGDYKATTIFLTQIRNRIAEANVRDRDSFYLMLAKHKKRGGEDTTEIIKTLKEISDDGYDAAAKYFELGALESERRNYNEAIQYDNQNLDTVRVKKLTIEQVLKSEIRRLENLLALKDYDAVKKYSDRILLTKGVYTEYDELLRRVKELRVEALYARNEYNLALDAINEVLDFYPNHPRHVEMEFLRAKCLEKMDREKEAVDAYRKIATSDRGIWGKSAQTELQQRDFKDNQLNKFKN